MILGFGSPIIGHRVSQSNYRILNFGSEIFSLRTNRKFRTVESF